MSNKKIDFESDIIIQDKSLQIKNNINWKDRAIKFGAYGVINTGHPKEKLLFVTNWQKEILFPHFSECLSGNEQIGLDYGCGAGRFTVDLSRISDCKIIGYDPTIELIDLAPIHNNVEYTHEENYLLTNKIKFDFIWCCLVLGNFDKTSLFYQAQLLMNQLNTNGFIFIVEVTSKQDIEDSHWKQYTCNTFQNAFSRLILIKVFEYIDLGQTISVFVGKFK